MNAQQKRAIAGLNRALAAAHKAGLVLCGMDSELIAYNGRALTAVEDAGNDLYYSQKALQGTDDCVVLTAAAYRESGGW